MSGFINELIPMRWKIFQVLSIDGENVGELAKRNVDKYLITNAQFDSFIEHHKSRLIDPTIIKAESNEVMRDSYILIDEVIITCESYSLNAIAENALFRY